MEWNGRSSADVTATPITSNKIPSRIIISKIINATIILLSDINSVEAKDITAEITMVTKKIMITQRMFLFRSFFVELGSDLDNSLSPFYQ